MRNVLRDLRRYAVVAVSAVAWHSQPALAQSFAEPLHIRASEATILTRYYAPYALQAAAAYLSVSSFDEALRRANGQPVLDGADVAIAVSPYASSQSIYGSSPDITARATKSLRAWQYQFGSEGYLKCYDNSDADCQKELSAWTFAISDGPAFHVWARTRYPHTERNSCTEVSIAFRGTNGSFSDWVSNFDSATSYVFDDYYLQLRRNINGIIKKISSLDCYRRARHKPQIVSVGHSLGGGLAQFAALANKPTGPRITKVFAFNSSPVTGAGLIDKAVLTNNARGLEIDRFYQTGEVLSRVRDVHEQFPKSSSACNPQVRTIVFDAVPSSNSVGLHNMAGLAARVVDLSYTQSGYEVPPGTKCPTRYRAPASDADVTYPSEEIAYAPGRRVVTIAQARRSGEPYGYAWGNSTFQYASEWDRSPPTVVRTKVRKTRGDSREREAYGPDVFNLMVTQANTTYPYATERGTSAASLVRVKANNGASGSGTR
jgi:pimeloyl-ACP methyl ester carboxylesterase